MGYIAPRGVMRYVIHSSYSCCRYRSYTSFRINPPPHQSLVLGTTSDHLDSTASFPPTTMKRPFPTNVISRNASYFPSPTSNVKYVASHTHTHRSAIRTHAGTRDEYILVCPNGNVPSTGTPVNTCFIASVRWYVPWYLNGMFCTAGSVLT